MTAKRDHYEVLGVGPSATRQEIRRAYRKKAFDNHPDRNKSPGAEDRLKEINEAYEVLSDDGKSAQYDLERRRGPSRPAGPPPPRSRPSGGAGRGGQTGGAPPPPGPTPGGGPAPTGAGGGWRPWMLIALFLIVLVVAVNVIPRR